MRKRKNSILAIDPGTREMGYACFDNGELEDYGVKDVRYVAKTTDVFEAVDKVVSRLVRQKRPEVMVIEKNNFSQIQQNLKLTLAISKIRVVARRNRVRVFEFDPRTIRKVTINDGNATKRQLARAIAMLYPETKAFLNGRNRSQERYYQNCFDAIACGLAFLKMSSTFTRGIRRWQST